MKNLLYILLSLLITGFYSCSDEDTPGPTSLEIGGNTEISFQHEGGGQAIDVITNAWDVSITMDAAGEGWCTMERKGRSLDIAAAYNSNQSSRTATITIVADNNTSVITVNQEGMDISIGGDQKLTISGGTASSAETTEEDTGFEKSFDGDFNTLWHTGWKDAPPYEAVYHLQDAEQLDYIMYYPRTPNGGNGNFGNVEIYVSTEATPTFTKVKTHDFRQLGSVAKVTLPAPVLKPKSVKFVILSGTNGNASCSEMEFYAIKQGAIKTVEIPLGGNAYVTTSGGTGGGSVNNTGFSSWTSTSTVYSTYFKVNKSGDLKLYLKYRADADGNVIEATCKDQKFEVTLPKPKVNTDTAVFLGVIEKVDPGYVKVDIKGVTLNGTVFAAATSLLVGGSSTEGINYVVNNDDNMFYFGRRGPSVHMAYTVPSGHTAEWFYNEVTVTEGNDVIGSYYMVNGFSQGYFGMQVNSATERRILFSVWSPYVTDDPSTIPDEDRVKLIRKGEGVTINDFGNEGSGGQSYLVYQWITGNTYKFLNRVRPIEDGYSEYTAYFYAPESGKWKLIAQWKRPKIQTYYTGMHSFLENFSPSMGHLTRKVYYGNQWTYTTAGQWVELTNGKFTTDATGSGGFRMDYKGGLERGGFFLQDCGFFDDYVAGNTAFARNATGSQPNIDWEGLE